jgi:hypothetical protein
MADGSQPVAPLLTPADLQSLASAIISGVQTVQYADRMVRYASAAEMLKAFQFGMVLLGYGGLPTTRLASFAKGTLGGGCGPEHAETGYLCPLWGTR